MALVICKECKAKISSDAQTCPQCGAKRPKQFSIWVIILGVVIVGIWSSMMNKVESNTAAVAGHAATSSAPEPSGWTYSSETDKMTGKPTKYAELGSRNSLSMEFPYNGKNMGRITVRQRALDGLQVLLAVDKGQINCNVVESCYVSLRFDDSPASRVGVTRPSDGSSETVFLRNPRGFLAKAQKAKSIKAEVEFFQNGTQVLEFGPVATPLTWKS